jgi:hypothetical protein
MSEVPSNESNQSIASVTNVAQPITPEEQQK